MNNLILKQSDICFGADVYRIDKYSSVKFT
jgi:hypothetical protein